MTTPVTFSDEELQKSKCQILTQGICPDKFDDKQLPTDVHIVTYTVGGETYHDAVRAYTKVDIFDEFYDKLKDIGHIVSIKSGYGSIRPNVFGSLKNT